MKSKLISVLLASVFINCAIAADENFVYPFLKVNLGNNNVVSYSDPNLDNKLEMMKQRLNIGGESIKIVNDIIAGDNLDLNNINPNALSRILICVSATLQIRSNPKKALEQYYDNYGSQLVRENPRVTYNSETHFFHGKYQESHVQLSSDLLLSAYYILTEQAGKLESEDKTQSQNDRNFRSKYNVAIGEAINLTQGKSEAEHYSILEANMFTFIDSITNEKENRTLDPEEILKILSWIYQGGTLGDCFEQSAHHSPDAEEQHRRAEQLRRQQEEQERREAEEQLRRKQDEQADQRKLDMRIQEKYRQFIRENAGKASASFRYFGLNLGATFDQVRIQYKRAIMRAHPDKGGSLEEIKNVNAQFEILEAYFRKGNYQGL